jgi:hypothetical protein
MSADNAENSRRPDQLTETSRIILDAWVFEIIPASETCKDWDAAQLKTLANQVAAAWTPYGNEPGNLPDDLRTRRAMLYEHAKRHTENIDWDPNIDGDD